MGLKSIIENKKFSPTFENNFTISNDDFIIDATQPSHHLLAKEFVEDQIDKNVDCAIDYAELLGDHRRHPSKMLIFKHCSISNFFS